MIAGFGSGAAFSLVSGMPGPVANSLQGAFATGCLFALMQGGFFQVQPCSFCMLHMSCTFAVCNCTVSQEDVKSVVTSSTTLLASASPLHSMAVLTSIFLICLLSSWVVLQLSKRFQQPQAGGPTAQYDRGAYMLDRLGLSVGVGGSCMPRQSTCTAFARNLLHTMRFAPRNRTAAVQVC